MYHQSVAAVEENRGRILVHRALGVAHERHILDDDHVVRVLARLVEEVVGRHHIVDHIAFANFFAAKLLRRRKVLAIVIAKVVVGNNCLWFDAGTDEKIDKDAFELCLA